MDQDARPAGHEGWPAYVAEHVEHLCRTCVQGNAVDGGGVSLVTRSGHRGTVCATDPRAAALEEAQFTLGEGPCFDAALSVAPVLVPDVSDPLPGQGGRWPGFLESASGIGVGAVFAFPLRIGAVSIGAMDLYRADPGELGPDEVRSAVLTADAMALFLLGLGVRSEELVDDEAAGSAYRLEVHAAAGMMSVQLGVPVDEALVHLRAAAYGQGRPIDEVAADIVRGRLRYSRGGQ